MSTPEMNEEQLRALYEEQMRQIRVDDVLMNSVVELINQGMRRTGLAQGYEGDRDPEQVRLAIESVRALLPVVESIAAEQMGPLRQALSQLQLAYVQIGGAPAEPAGAPSPEPVAGASGGAVPGAGRPGGAASAPAAGPDGPPSQGEEPGQPGPAQRSGRLWVPGQ